MHESATPERSRPTTGSAGARRLLALSVASAILLLAVAPQCYVWVKLGRSWHGAFAYFTTDERAYAAYVNALAAGRPRRNDPYTGRDDHADAPQAESLFSIQFVPAYALALSARLLRLKTDACFFLLLCACAVASALVLFRLIHALTCDLWLAAAGTLFVLCLGSLAASYGSIWDAPHLADVHFRHMPFLRRYQPAFPFPLFFLFCTLVWRALTTRTHSLRMSEPRTRSSRAAYVEALSAGLVLAVLVFSYFYLWTAAAAWLTCLAALWLAARPVERRASLKLFAFIAAPALLALAPYAFLLAHRAATMESVQELARTHAPDLFRVPELLGYSVLVALAWTRGKRRAVALENPVMIFAASFALLPFALFNQQIATGRSLQPLHYDVFIANYCALLAIVLTASLMRVQPFRLPVLLAVALVAYGWATLDTALWSRQSMIFFRVQNDITLAVARLREFDEASRSRLDTNANRLDTDANIFSPTPSVEDLLPALAPQPVLWSVHTAVFSGASAQEEHERLLRQLYYSGVDLSDAAGRDYETLDRRTKYYVGLLLGSERINANLRRDWQPVTPEETALALRGYADFAASFDRTRAASPALAYLVVYDYEHHDLANLDRWYERDAGEHLGHFTLYHLKLRP